jgi:hypothetical protein
MRLLDGTLGEWWEPREGPRREPKDLGQALYALSR